jgi:diguanylate cyclase (GGDEF)-like protein
MPANTSIRTIHTRSEFEGAIEELRHKTPMSLAMLDLDEFQAINDDYGHDAGDTVLRSLEAVLLGSLPKEAVIGRFGGDEYAIGLPEMPAENALILLEEVRSHFSSREPSPQVPRRVHLSVGIASLPPHASSTSELRHAADEALYRAKQEGRRRVAIYVDSKMTLKSNYYAKSALERLSKLSSALNRTEASLLREALDDLVIKYLDHL